MTKKEHVVTDKEALKMIEKYREMTPEERHEYGKSLVAKKTSVSSKLRGLEGKEGSFAELKRRTLSKKEATLKIVIDACATIKYEHLKSGGSLEEYTPER